MCVCRVQTAERCQAAAAEDPEKALKACIPGALSGV